MADSTSLFSIISRVKPHEIYNLAAQSHVHVSFEMPEHTASCTGMGVLRLLEAIRAAGLEKTTKLFQASSSEMFGATGSEPQDEDTPFNPCSPYGVSKLTAHFTVLTYRAAYGIFCVSGILFNHESPRRGTSFVSRKITRGLASILKGELPYLELGNLDARRDWGHARDYVKAMWLMLQQETPTDFVVATGEQHSVRDFCEVAFAMVGLPLEWRGQGLEEVGFSGERVLVRVAAANLRPTEVPALRGEASRIKKALGWRLETTFPRLVYEMLASDMRLAGLSPPPPSICSERLAHHLAQRGDPRAHEPSAWECAGTHQEQQQQEQQQQQQQQQGVAAHTCAEALRLEAQLPSSHDTMQLKHPLETSQSSSSSSSGSSSSCGRPQCGCEACSACGRQQTEGPSPNPL
ncbi:hypothetical protein Emed_004485 [Eimeria media]